jgi:leader peptidase (prepilin peptidase)/N-methyltransferase
MLVELACGLWTAFLFWHYGLSWELLVTALFSYIFVAIGLIDLRTRLVFGIIVYPAIGLAALAAAFVLPHGIINALEGAGLGAAVILIPWALTRGRGMGFGDVEIAFLIGLLTGFPEVMVPIIMGIVAGGLVAIVLLVFNSRAARKPYPSGPF